MDPLDIIFWVIVAVTLFALILSNVWLWILFNNYKKKDEDKDNE